MGQSPYLCSGSAGFCCWGLGKGRPFPHVKAWGGTAQITTQGVDRFLTGKSPKCLRL
jgi:hypothetical protein